MDIALLVIRLLLTAVFLVASLAKLANVAGPQRAFTTLACLICSASVGR